MIPRSIVLAVAFSAAAVSTGLAQAVAPAGAGAPAAPVAEPALSPEQIFETYGWILSDRSQLTALGMSASEVAAFARGLSANAQGKPAPADFDQVVRVAQEFLSTRAQQVQGLALGKNRAEEEKYLATLDQNPAIKQTASGLRYEILAPGTDPKPTLANTVVAHYTLSFADGTVAETSRTSGQPAEFPLQNVVAAWQEGLQLIGTGGKLKLHVPSKLGYGDEGSQGIPPGKLLVFDVELIAVKATPPATIEPLPTPGLTP